MKRIFVDTGAWYALIDKKDPDHVKAKQFYNNNTLPFVTTNFIFDESITLMMSRLGWKIAVKFGEALKTSGLVAIATITGPDEDKAWEIFLQYEEAGFSYTDCSSFAVMERLKIDTAFTFDMHFKTMKHAIVPEL
jgi:hypothetical protein